MLVQNLSFPKTPALGDPTRLAAGDVDRYRRAFGERDPEALLAWALERFRGRIALVTALQAEGIVLLDLARRAGAAVRVITLDTGRLPDATYALIETVEKHFGVTVETVHPDARALAALARRGGPNLFYRSLDDRLACCRVRKVEPLARALGGLDAWITGLRRSQSPERATTPVLARDEAHGGLLKLAPLAAWSHEQVWEHIRRHKLPYHPYYDRGYTSIGCAPCSRPVALGAPARSGRWWWERDSHKECGLHLAPAAAAAPADAVRTTAPVRAAAGAR